MPAKLIDRVETIEAMNHFASRKQPFVFIISFDGNSNIIEPNDKAASLGIFMETPGYKNHNLSLKSKESFSLTSTPVETEIYKKAFDTVMDHIRYGNTFLINLTFPTRINTRYSLKEIFCSSSAMFKLMVDDAFVVFSPERFIKIEDGVISSNPMKGTIDATLPNAWMQLKSDIKEDAEHNTIVDLIRNDLGMIAKDIRVKRFKYIEKIRTHSGELLQMSSEITGNLPYGFQNNLGDILFKILPAGSVTGAPKPKTVEIINETEICSRGFYTGVFGYFDGRNLDSAVIIRYIEKQDETMYFKSGGGITFMSDWEKEYQEMLNKVYVPIY